jgi:hypothetical protein
MKIDSLKKSFVLVTVVLFISSAAALAQDVNPPEEQVEPPKKEYSPFVGDHFPTKVFFGDTHVHTSYSTDAGMVGTTLGSHPVGQ